MIKNQTSSQKSMFGNKLMVTFKNGKASPCDEWFSLGELTHLLLEKPRPFEMFHVQQDSRRLIFSEIICVWDQVTLECIQLIIHTARHFPSAIAFTRHFEAPQKIMEFYPLDFSRDPGNYFNTFCE